MMLQLSGLHAHYGAIHALHGVDLSVQVGEIVTLIGANGAGKSTLMMTIFGSPRARKGRIVFDGRDITATADARDRAPRHRAIAGRPPHLSAHDGLENLQMGAGHRRLRSFRRDLAARVRAVPAPEERCQQRGGTLSGGEQQMLAIARALMSRPRCCCSTSLRSASRRSSSNRFSTRCATSTREEGLTVFLVEQNATTR
jgi:branched-chain amino acid transport system ATP-binding protein